jgi:hypothetical protein
MFPDVGGSSAMPGDRPSVEPAAGESAAGESRAAEDDAGPVAGTDPPDPRFRPLDPE